LMRQAYGKSACPAAFVGPVLRTPHLLWFPTRGALRAAGIIAAPAPQDASRASSTAS
jgi:hypothetical protein